MEVRWVGPFGLVWSGQLVSLMGSGMTTFALGVWVFLTTGSATQFTLISFFGVLPGILALPLAGALVDRWGGRKAMIVSDLGEGVGVLLLALLLWAGVLGVPMIYAVAMANATFGALRWPALSALTPLLVPREHLGRANGLVQVAEAAATIGAPLLGGYLVAAVSLRGVLLIDVCTYVFGMATLILVRHRRRPPEPEARRASSLGEEIGYGWRYIRARPGLSSMLVFFALTNFMVLGLARTLFTPLVLSLGGPEVLGTVLSTGGVGFLLGGVLMSVWGGPRRRIHGVLGFTAAQGVFVAVGGLRPDLMLVGAAVFMIMFFFPIVHGSSQALWQAKVALDVQGRVFSVRRMIGWSTFPLAYLAGGPMVDYLFEPLLAEGGPLASTVGACLGVGTGRGIGLLFVIVGVLTVLITLACYAHPRLRLVEDELPDAHAD